MRKRSSLKKGTYYQLAERFMAIFAFARARDLNQGPFQYTLHVLTVHSQPCIIGRLIIDPCRGFHKGTQPILVTFQTKVGAWQGPVTET